MSGVLDLWNDEVTHLTLKVHRNDGRIYVICKDIHKITSF